MEVSCESFYGAPRQSIRDRRRRQRLDKAERALRTKVFATSASQGSSLTQPDYPDDYLVFKKQKEALEKAAELNLSTFAFETDASGARSFVVSHPDKMWTSLTLLKSHHRHIYEVIPQGLPSKLYFDIEYKKSDNPERSEEQGAQSLRDLIDHVLHQLQVLCGVQSGVKDVLDLDSSTETKFSHHVIICNAVFENNFECGAFVQHLCNNLDQDLKDRISYRDGDGAKKIFVDGAVYTKNRNFRTFLSSKLGKSTTLQLSAWSKSILERPNKSICDRNIFKRSLISSNFEESRGKRINFSGNHQLATNLEKISGKSFPGLKRKREQEKSPFPEVDEFILGLLDSRGYIRKSLWKPMEQTLEYEIAGFRYCDNVKRQHKSNNIRFVVLLARGVYFQLCHDPDCADFKSRDHELPKDVQPWLLLFEHDGQGQELDDAEDNDFLASVADCMEDELLDYDNLFTEF